MNKFVRTYLILPLVSLMLLLPIFTLTACLCTSVNPGKPIDAIVALEGGFTSDEEKTKFTKKNQKDFKYIVYLFVQKWVIVRHEKYTTKFEEKLRKFTSIDAKKKVVKDFLTAFKSPDNNHFYKAEFKSKQSVDLKAVEFAPPKEGEKTTKIVNFNLWFKTEDNDKSWILKISLPKFKIKASKPFDKLGDEFKILDVIKNK